MRIGGGWNSPRFLIKEMLLNPGVILLYSWVLLLTPWRRNLLEKLTGLQLVKKFPSFYGTRRFITVLTSVRHLSLSWASPTQSVYQHPTSWRSIFCVMTPLETLPPGRSEWRSVLPVSSVAYENLMLIIKWGNMWTQEFLDFSHHMYCNIVHYVSEKGLVLVFRLLPKQLSIRDYHVSCN